VADEECLDKLLGSLLRMESGILIILHVVPEQNGGSPQIFALSSHC
jgi:hypothetical protein